MVVGSSKVLIYFASAMQEANKEEVTHKHEHRAILAFTTPVLCGVGFIAHVVGLKLVQVSESMCTSAYLLTLIPHRKGEMLVPTSGSWLIAIISWLVRISKDSLLADPS